MPDTFSPITLNWTNKALIISQKMYGTKNVNIGVTIEFKELKKIKAAIDTWENLNKGGKDAKANKETK